jgi:hypothetical protein
VEPTSNLAGLPTFTVSVLGVTAPVPVTFEGFCVYRQGGEERRKDLSGEGNLSHSFRAEALVSCEVRRTSDEGWITLVVSREGETLHDSGEVRSSEPLRFRP